MSPPKRTFRNYNVPTPLKLPKGTLIKIDWKEHEQEVKRIWSGKPPTKLVERWKEEGVSISNAEKYYSPTSVNSRYNAVKKLVGNNNNLAGYCSKCRSLNTYLLKQKVSGAVIITRYCNEHVPDKNKLNLT